MKNILLIIGLICLCSIANTQEERYINQMKDPINLVVSETSIKVDKRQSKAFSILVHADERELEKKWKSYYEKNFQCEFEKSKGVYVSNTISMANVTNESVQLIGKIESADSGAKLTMAVNLGTEFIHSSKHPNESAKLKSEMKTFVAIFYEGWYDKVIARESKEYNKTVNAHEKLIKAGDGLVKDVEKEKSNISKYESNIVNSEQEIEDLHEKIESLKVDIEESEKEIIQLEISISDNTKETENQRVLVDSVNKELEKLKVNFERVKSMK